jgi:uncharacterized protein (DUF2141 family)
MRLFIARMFVKHNPSDKIIAKPQEERSKGMDSKKIIIAIFILLLGLSLIPGLAQERGFSVKGEISFPKKGAIFIQLLTKEDFESNKGSRFQSIIEVSPEDLKKGKTSFSFSNVPEGTYGIRCFQD